VKQLKRNKLLNLRLGRAECGICIMVQRLPCLLQKMDVAAFVYTSAFVFVKPFVIGFAGEIHRLLIFIRKIENVYAEC